MFKAEEEGAALSRSTGLPPRMGKATERVSASVPESIKDAVTQHCRLTEMSESEFILWLLVERFMGREEALRMQQERLNLVFGTAPQLTQKERA